MNTDPKEKELAEKFYSDPAWSYVEEKLMAFVNELQDFTTLDETLPAETLKAQVTARKIARDQIIKFLNQCGILRNINNIKTTFK